MKSKYNIPPAWENHKQQREADLPKQLDREAKEDRIAEAKARRFLQDHS